MSKKSTKQSKNKMDIDIDALLMSEESGKENSPIKKSAVEKRQKKVRYSSPASEKEKPAGSSTKKDMDYDENNDLLETVKNFKNDFGKPMKAKKAMLEDFTSKVIEVHQTKAAELRKKQTFEEKELQKKFNSEINQELEKWKDDISRVIEEEEKIVQLLQQHMKIMQKASNTAGNRKKNLLKIAKSFEEQKEELIQRHEKEISVTMESARKEIAEMQVKVIADIQKEEMTSIKRLLCSGMFF